MIQVDISNIWGALSLPDLLAVEQDIAQAHDRAAEAAQSRQQPSPELLAQLLAAAEQLRCRSELCVVAGTGAPWLAAKAAMALLPGQSGPRLLFTGSSLSTRRWRELTAQLEGRDFSLIVLGDALETGIALRGLRWLLERKYGTDEASRRIIAVADAPDSPLHRLAEDAGWQRFTDAGLAAALLPMAVAGIDIQALCQGAAEAREAYALRSFENPVWLYAGVRYALQRQGKTGEWIRCLEPDFEDLGRWWQECFAGIGGIFSVPMGLTADAGPIPPEVFETLVWFRQPQTPHLLGADWKNLDDLNYLDGKSLEAVQQAAFEAAATAHGDQGVPVITLELGELDARSLGALLAFLELASHIAAFAQGIGRAVPGAFRQAAETLLGKPAPEA